MTNTIFYVIDLASPLLIERMMSKRAEQRALEAYPKECGTAFHSAFGTFEFDRNAPERQGYQKGYEQAEKDLALSWEDVNLIDSILIDMQDEGVERYGGLRQYYEETLKRFNDQRKK